MRKALSRVRTRYRRKHATQACTHMTHLACIDAYGVSKNICSSKLTTFATPSQNTRNAGIAALQGRSEIISIRYSQKLSYNLVVAGEGSKRLNFQ